MGRFVNMPVQEANFVRDVESRSVSLKYRVSCTMPLVLMSWLSTVTPFMTRTWVSTYDGSLSISSRSRTGIVAVCSGVSGVDCHSRRPALSIRFSSLSSSVQSAVASAILLSSEACRSLVTSLDGLETSSAQPEGSAKNSLSSASNPPFSTMPRRASNRPE